jgi:predicted ATP-grasp superfamily ATP-dependent carboligase
MKLLVCNCHTRMGYAVACSLARHGHEVVAAGTHVPTMTRGLRGVVAEVAYPDPFVHEDKFVGVIGDAVRRYGIDAVLPVHEEMFVVACHREAFAPARVIAPAFDYLMRAQDKYQTFQLAKSLGLSTPETCLLTAGFSPRQAAAELGYPMIVKPRFGSGANGVMVISSEAELHCVEALMRPENFSRLIAQERVPGCGAGVGALMWDGRLTAACGHKRLREVPISGGTSTARITYESRPLVEAAERILLSSKLEGVAMVEFRVDEASGRHWLLEINPRYWGGLPTGISSGVDFPVLHVDCAMGRVPQAVQRPHRRVESRWLLGEIRAFVEHLQAGKFVRAVEAFRVTPDVRLEIDDIGQAGTRAFFHQLSAYVSNLRRYNSLGGHSDSKTRFFERYTAAELQS